MLDGMLDEKNFFKKIKIKFLQSAFAQFHPTTSTFKDCMFIHWQFKMAEAKDFATMILLNEHIMNSDNEKRKRGKTGSKGESKEVS